jgi:hypothetical protein
MWVRTLRSRPRPIVIADPSGRFERRENRFPLACSAVEEPKEPLAKLCAARRGAKFAGGQKHRYLSFVDAVPKRTGYRAVAPNRRRRFR